MFQMQVATGYIRKHRFLAVKINELELHTHVNIGKSQSIILDEKSKLISQVRD